jgi:hypothetical protein
MKLSSSSAYLLIDNTTLTLNLAEYVDIEIDIYPSNFTTVLSHLLSRLNCMHYVPQILLQKLLAVTVISSSQLFL